MNTGKRRIYLAIAAGLLVVIAAMAYRLTVTEWTKATEGGFMSGDLAAGFQRVSARMLQQSWPNEHSIEKK